MITDEDRALILERLRAETSIRKQLAQEEPDDPPRRSSWVESKLGLLVIGALLTGVLIPLFQATQETLKWTRQNRYDNLKYRLDSVRSAMKELTLTHAFVAEAFERARLVRMDAPVSAQALKQYRLQILDMHNRRFQQNARFVGSLDLLDDTDREGIQLTFNEYVSAVQQFNNVTEELVSLSSANDKKALTLQNAQVSLSKDVSVNYERTLSMLTMNLHRLEVKSEHFF